MASRRLEVVIAGDASGATRALGQLENRTQKTGRAMDGMRRIGGALAGVFAGVQIGQFLRGAVSEAEEAQTVMRQTNAVIQSTGGVAGVTAGHLQRMADRLSQVAAVDDEVIQQGGNLLLTFRNVRAEGGIFDDALASALDMSAALGTELQPNIMAVGRALNDPIAGLSRLTRMGVSFTQAQKDQVAAMMYFGDTAGAQRVILEELSTEFGGAAEANDTASQRMSVAWENIQETIGTLLLPALDSLSQALSGVSDWFSGLSENTQTLILALSGATVAFLALWAAASLPVAAVVAAIAVAVAEWMYLYKNVEQVRVVLNAAWAAASEFAKHLVKAVQSVDFEPMLKSLRDLKAQIDILGQSFGGWGTAAKAAIVVVGAGLQYIIAVARSVLIGATVLIQAFSRLGQLTLAQLQGSLNFVRSLVSAVSSAVGSAISWVQKLGGQALGTIVSSASSLANAFSRVVSYIQSAVTAVGNLASRISSLPSLPSLNIPGFAVGTGSAPPGLAWVGERGPELVAFRGGERVYNASQSARMVRNARQPAPTDANGDLVINTTVMLDGKAVGRSTTRHQRTDARAYAGADGSSY